MDVTMVHRIFPQLFEAAGTDKSAEQWRHFFDEVTKSITATAASIGQPNGGEDAKRVEAMPVGLVLTTSIVGDLKKFSNDTERWVYLPFAQARAGLDEEEEKLKMAERSLRPGVVIASMLLPACRQVFGAQTRTQRTVDALRVIEAIRMHAAEAGELPETLDDITVVPIPLNPATNKPFEYQLKDGTATLELPRSDGVYYIQRFELRL